ncbi:RNA-directed DNA polymerase, eukaryota, reverse transcriptase zinc-binding domain protein [Tanacetum coccineum]
MEVLNLLIKKNIEENVDFKYHFGCKNLKITHMCFADDLLVFCHGDSESVKVIKKSLDEFSRYSGLLPNMQKSTIFFGGLSSAELQIILNIIPFTVGKLPVRYLGVPLITKQLSIRDCKPLVNKVNAKVIYEINKLLKGFLWCQDELTKGKAKVSWDAVCKPNNQEGLGLKNWGVWNELGKYPMSYLRDEVRGFNTVWISRNAHEKIFKVSNVWEDMNCNDNKVDWHPLVWFAQSIPRHAFVTWLAIQQRLMTQDKLLIWRPNEDFKCALCNKCTEVDYGSSQNELGVGRCSSG